MAGPYPQSPVTTTGTRNADLEWDNFDSEAYFRANYRKLLSVDATIIKLVADFFLRQASRRWRNRAIDVGTGTNLYPAMTMLPFAAEIVLYEPAHSNRQWLVDQLRRPADSWQEFWDVAQRDRPAYARIERPLDSLGSRAVVERGNVFSLQPDQYDLGTMFFVAESITNRDDEFRRATRLFVGSLLKRAPFAAAFMRDSSSYTIGEQTFPACAVNERDVEECLTDIAHIDHIHVIPDHEVREGYDGMIVAVGWKK